MTHEPEYVRRAREAARKHKAATNDKAASNGKPAPRNPAYEIPPGQRGEDLEGPRSSTKGKAQQEQERLAIVLNMADVAPAPVDWLWPRWMPRGTLTLLDGDPGLGKSTISLDVAARVSRGWRMPPEGGPSDTQPGNVLILTAEDDPARTVRPRLEAAGADSARVFLLESIKVGEDEFPPCLPWNIAEVESVVKERAIDLLIIDPIMAYLSGKVDSHKDQDIRRVLFQLAKLAKQNNLSVLCIRHLSKTFAVPALYRGGGSIGIIGAARSALLVGRHPDDKALRVLASNKSNLGPGPKSLAYRIEQSGDVARIAWAGEVDLGPDDILGPAQGRRGRKPKEVDRAIEFLEKALAGGPVDAEALQKQAEAKDVSARTLKRAKKEMGIIAEEKKDAEGKVIGWFCRLPPEGQNTHIPNSGPLDETQCFSTSVPEGQNSAYGNSGPLDSGPAPGKLFPEEQEGPYR